jgi:hypothetical protein
VLLWPGVYHSGFNQGWNVAEAVNFATKSWINEGNKYFVCRCKSCEDKGVIELNMGEIKDAAGL